MQHLGHRHSDEIAQLKLALEAEREARIREVAALGAQKDAWIAGLQRELKNALKERDDLLRLLEEDDLGVTRRQD